MSRAREPEGKDNGRHHEPTGSTVHTFLMRFSSRHVRFVDDEDDVRCRDDRKRSTEGLGTEEWSSRERQWGALEFTSSAFRMPPCMSSIGGSVVSLHHLSLLPPTPSEVSRWRNGRLLVEGVENIDGIGKTYLPDKHRRGWCSLRPNAVLRRLCGHQIG